MPARVVSDVVIIRHIWQVFSMARVLLSTGCVLAVLLTSVPTKAMSIGDFALGVFQEMAKSSDAERPRARQVRAQRAETLWLVIASRESASEAIDLAQGYADTLGPCLVVQSRNGRYAVVAGTLNRDRSKINIATLKELRFIPADSFLSDGANLDTVVWSAFEANASTNIMTQPVLRRSVGTLQRAMAALNLYRGPVDGLVGISTVDAFDAYRAKYGVVAEVLDRYALSSLAQAAADGFPNDSERRYAQSLGFENATAYTEATQGGFSSAAVFNQARSLGFRTNGDWQAARNGGFQDGDEFMRAKAGGFENAVSYRRGQEKGFATSREMADYEASGFQDANAYRAAKRAGFSSKSAFDKAQAEDLKAARGEATILLADADAFLRLNRNAEGILAIAAEAATLNGLVVSGSADTIRSSARRLDGALGGIPGFGAFKEARAKERADDRLRRLAGLRRDLDKINGDLTGWVAVNLTSPKTSEIVAELTLLTAALKKDDPEDLEEAKRRVVALIERQGIAAGLEQAASESSAVAVQPSAAPLASVTPANAFLLQGNPDDVVIAYNSGTRSPSITRTLLGSYSFTTGKASVCMLGIDRNPALGRALALNLARFGVVDVRMEPGNCAAKDVGRSDLVLLQRKQFLEAAPATAIGVLDAVEKGDLRVFEELTYDQLKTAQASEASLAARIAADVAQDARNGFGALIPVNGAGPICVVLGAEDEAHTEMLKRLSAFAQSEFGRSPAVSFVSLDDAFQSVRKDRCTMVYAEQPSLKLMSAALERDGRKASFAPLWFETKDIEAATAALKEKRDSETADAEARRLAAAAERERAEKKSAEVAAQRQVIESGLRRQYAAEASAVQNALTAGLKAGVLGQPSVVLEGREKELAEEVRTHFPAFTTWAGSLAGDAWKPIGIDTSIVDYGTVDWKQRQLEALVLRAEVQVVSAERGEYREHCFLLGWISDDEFQTYRDPIETDCDGPDASMADWKTGHHLQSRWVAP